MLRKLTELHVEASQIVATKNDSRQVVLLATDNTVDRQRHSLYHFLWLARTLPINSIVDP